MAWRLFIKLNFLLVLSNRQSMSNSDLFDCYILSSTNINISLKIQTFAPKNRLIHIDFHKTSFTKNKMNKLSNYSILIDNVRSAQNVGAIFRTADAFACKHLYLTGITAIPPNKEILKTALGATESVEWSHHADTIELLKDLKSQGFQIVGIEQTATSKNLQTISPNSDKHTVLIVGNEVDGISPEVLALCDFCIEIPQSGIKKSLNVSVAASIVMWHFYKDNL